MSDEELILIPTDPHFLPSTEQVEQAISALSSAWPDAKLRVVHGSKQSWEWETPPSVLVQVITRDKVDFVHGFENFMAVFCPRCESEIDRDAWDRAMNRAHERDYADLSFETPCCGFRTNLNSLRYDWPAGFAKFSLTMMNSGRDLDNETVNQIGVALGCDLRKVQAHI